MTGALALLAMGFTVLLGSASPTSPINPIKPTTPTAPTAPTTPATPVRQPPFTLSRTHDSLYFLNEWQLPYPVYRLCTGDVDGDGRPDALVGVVKTTRFYRQPGRRLFIFKLVKGKVRPLWLGSKLGGQLVDFSFNRGRVRSLERAAKGRYTVAEWQWHDFGLRFSRYLVRNTSLKKAQQVFSKQ